MATRTPPEGPISPRHPLAATIRRLKREIDTLNREHSDALKAATFIGMTPDQARDHEERRKRITLLVRELATVESAQ